MKAKVKWTKGMLFEGLSDSNTVLMDARPPLGLNQGMTPKELVANGLGGCTAMDVIALLKKHKQVFDSFEVDVEITSTTAGHPIVFQNALLTFSATGNIDKTIYLDSVKLSQTKYCGVSAMLAKALPIKYNVVLNNEKIGEGEAHFEDAGK
ncbi:MAG: OsmC family protein [Pseudobdellovibrio sp.]